MEYVKSHIWPKMSILGYGVIFIGDDLSYPDFNSITKKNSPIDVHLTWFWRPTGVIFSGFDVIFRLRTALSYISDGKADDFAVTWR